MGNGLILFSYFGLQGAQDLDWESFLAPTGIGCLSLACSLIHQIFKILTFDCVDSKLPNGSD